MLLAREDDDNLMTFVSPSHHVYGRLSLPLWQRKRAVKFFEKIETELIGNNITKLDIKVSALFGIAKNNNAPTTTLIIVLSAYTGKKYSSIKTSIKTTASTAKTEARASKPLYFLFSFMCIFSSPFCSNQQLMIILSIQAVCLSRMSHNAYIPQISAHKHPILYLSANAHMKNFFIVNSVFLKADGLYKVL